MTHTIHPKMLEKVARIINPTAFTDIPSSFLMKCPKGTDIEHAKKVYQDIIDPDRKLAYEKAQAAILAMWEGLPMEYAPKDGEEILILSNLALDDPDILPYFGNYKGESEDGPMYKVPSMGGVSSCCGGYPSMTVWPDRFIPIPAQETE